MKKKLSMIITSLGLVLTFSTYAIAASFPDVDEAKWGWAKPMIEDMSSKGIIAGYEDKTFKPAQGVTKIESLILIARIMGVNDKSNAEYVTFAEKEYADTLKSYNISYKKEISYLLYKDILTSDELAAYIGETNATAVAKRYEAAILLTKAMGAEKEVKSKVVSVLSFQDTASIPAQAKAYVEYVRNENIMQGISTTEFGPMVDVNRAMMAVMLYKVMQKNLYKEIEGSIVSVNESSKTITIKESGDQKAYQLTDNTILRLDGAPARLSAFVQDVDVTLTYKGEQIFMLEGLTPLKTEIVEGVVADVRKTGTKRISINSNGDYASGVRECILDDNVQVTFNGEAATIDAINQYDTAKVTMQRNKAVKIAAESRNKEINGKVVKVNADSDSAIKVTVDLDNGKTQEYGVADSITVKRNGKTSDLMSIISGDSVEVTLEFNKIKKLEARSDKRTVEGIIEEINISKNPTITIKDKDGVKTYNLRWDMEIEIDDLKSQIYDLRLGYNAELFLDSNMVTQLEAKKVEEVQQITGRVELANKSYYMLNVAVTGTDNNTTTQQIFVKKDAKIIRTDSTSSKNYNFEDINQGDTITAIGFVNTGVFEANTVIIIQRVK